MAKVAVVTKMVAGTQLAANNKKDNKTIAAKMNKTMWRDKAWPRSNAATLALLNKSHRADPRQAEGYYVMCLARRMVKKSEVMRNTMEEVWRCRHEGNEADREDANIWITRERKKRTNDCKPCLYT